MKKYDIKNIVEAGNMVIEQLQSQDFKEITSVWINNRRNLSFTAKREGDLECYSYFLKYDSNPYYAGAKELPPEKRFKGPAVCINKLIYETYIEPMNALILYAIPENIYHITIDNFISAGVDHRQKTNQEDVIMTPLTEFKVWYKDVV